MSGGRAAGGIADVLTPAEHIKFGLLSEGLVMSPEARAYIVAENGERPMTPADYASTSGIILALDDDVWVNAPIAEYNPNFVGLSTFSLELEGDALMVRGDDRQSSARFWMPPAYHGRLNDRDEALNSYAFTHGDRVRISPIEGCAMACHFCDLPYEFRYRRKSVEGLLDSVVQALDDEIQPAGHILISGGTPRPEDYDYVREVYERVLTGFPEIPVDIMMVPVGSLLELEWLDRLGVNELSVNIEIFDRVIAHRIMRRKSDQGLDHYLSFLERAAEVLGAGRVRSMLLVGIEPVEQTLAGVAAIAERGGVPVLSPFRPDPSTPMRNASPPTQKVIEQTYLRAHEIAARYGVPLGPSCIPCTHNTLTLSEKGAGDAHEFHRRPLVV
jgi:radical SAM family protein